LANHPPNPALSSRAQLAPRRAHHRPTIPPPHHQQDLLPGPRLLSLNRANPDPHLPPLPPPPPYPPPPRPPKDHRSPFKPRKARPRPLPLNIQADHPKPHNSDPQRLGREFQRKLSYPSRQTTCQLRLAWLLVLPRYRMVEPLTVMNSPRQRNSDAS
jgi:hypothetical protein